MGAQDFSSTLAGSAADAAIKGGKPAGTSLRRLLVRRYDTRRDAFTLIELIIVVAIIVVLTGLVLGTSSYVQQKGASSRAEAEMKAIEAACESYKADNGIYPKGADTDGLDPKTHHNPTEAVYTKASLLLYKELSGDRQPLDRRTDNDARQYMAFKPEMLSPSKGASVTNIQDPFGYSYGYSTANQDSPSKGYNPTFDLWSTSGTTRGFSADRAKWLKNW